MDARSIIDGFKDLTVLIVGDLMLDKYVYGSVERVSPEAPVPVLVWKEEINRLGGAANVALNTTALGATTILCGVLGRDKEGALINEMLENAGISAENCVQSPNRPTTVKTRFLSGNQHLMRLDTEKSDDLFDNEQELLVERVGAVLSRKSIDVIILQDYNKGVLSKSVISKIIELSEKHDIPVAVDPKAKNFWEYKKVALFKPNLKEIRDALSSPIKIEKEALAEASQYLFERLRVKAALITLSDCGVFAHDGDEVVLEPTQKRKVADVCGAGDAVIAIVSLALACGASVLDMAKLANLAGGQIVEKIGVVPIDLEQLRSEMRKHSIGF